MRRLTALEALRLAHRDRTLGRARRHGRQVVHVLHVRKTGGTAVLDALGRARGSSYKIVLHPHRVVLADIPRGDKVAFVLRDPLTRFVSGFYSRLRQGGPRYHFPWTEAERAAFAVFSTPDQLAAALSSEDSDVQGRAEQAMRDIRHVQDGYATWFGEPGAFLSRRADIAFVGRQETLAADFERLKLLLSLPPELALPQADVTRHSTPAGLDTSLSSVSRDNLRRWYAADIAFLELCREHAHEIGYVPPA